MLFRSRKGREVPIFIVWKFDKPCDDVGGIAVFQEIDELERLRRLYKMNNAVVLMSGYTVIY